MTRRELTRHYFNWMYGLVCGKKRKSYKKLLRHLYNREFVYMIEMDGNRAEDGIDLRYRFAQETGQNEAMVSSYLDNQPCSVLEMLVALCVRCEEEITDNMGENNNVQKWFWNCINNLGLKNMDDEKFDVEYTDEVIDHFLNREYTPDGRGSLFLIKNSNYDMRNVEIWYQMLWYLDSIL